MGLVVLHLRENEMSMVEQFVLKGMGLELDPGEYWVATRYVRASDYERLETALHAAVAHLDQPVLHSGSSGQGAISILRSDINVALAVMRAALGSSHIKETPQ